MQIVAMTAAYAAEIVTWSYPPPYDCYDMTAHDPVALTDPATGMFALTDGAELIGFRSFGADGQVPGGDYDGSALDTGGGLRPDLVGQGLGRRAIATGLAYGQERFSPPAFRVTIASFNLRARRVVERLDFEQAGDFQATVSRRHYVILVRRFAGNLAT